jgi:hypothetical protein
LGANVGGVLKAIADEVAAESPNPARSGAAGREEQEVEPCSTSSTLVWALAPSACSHQPLRLLRRPGPPQKITGENLAKGRRTKAQRINLAEALHAGKVEVIKPTLKLSAVMARVALADVYRARKPKPKTPSLAELLANSSPAERIEATRALGVDVVWDTMIMPIVADEKASGPAA